MNVRKFPNKDFAYYYGAMDRKYAIPAATRWHTLKAALTLAGQRAPKAGIRILETGCAREPDDWGGGMSTVIFGDYCKRFGGSVISVDNEPKHITRCEMLTVDFKAWISLVHDDSVHYLRNHRSDWPVFDLIYLDSFDYPYGALLDIYGGKQDLNKAIATLAEIPEAEIVEKYWYIIEASQTHCLNEVKAADEAGILDHAVLLIDDNSMPGGGKPRLAKQWLLENGWTLVMDFYQTLWVRI